MILNMIIGTSDMACMQWLDLFSPAHSPSADASLHSTADVAFSRRASLELITPSRY